MISGRAPLLVAGGGALMAGVLLDRWCSSTPARDGSLSLLVAAGMLLVLYAWREARSLV